MHGTCRVSVRGVRPFSLSCAIALGSLVARRGNSLEGNIAYPRLLTELPLAVLSENESPFFTCKNFMPNFFLTDANGQKHQINEQQLQALAAQGKITPNTPLETDTGHKGLAGQIPGLQFNAAAPSPFAQPAQVTPPPAGSGTVSGKKSGASTVALILGILGMLALPIFPLFAFPITVAGLICGRRGLAKDGSGIAKAGFILSIIGLALVFLFVAIDVFSTYR